MLFSVSALGAAGSRRQFLLLAVDQIIPENAPDHAGTMRKLPF
ncbi:hypothetical protein Arad_12270 (plasmid) [Rhizobium rhizogenes K84]|uniref:Uncharacterized protein n=1 Tax=Rhizobium rhizogenes (strain K84 / ATCC BAA-868) TaxID=311403 RepID=B9JQ66_RHIR8|nr:hypothetical protein Arad_12270 [Rhizobium rhizogenes K84]